MKQKKNLKFKIQYVPLADERIESHKDFGTLMAAYAVAPKPNVFRRWMNNRYFLFSSGLVVGLTFSGLMLFKNFTQDVQPVVTNNQTQEAIQHSASTSTITEQNNVTSISKATVNPDADNNNDVNEASTSDVATKALDTNSNSEQPVAVTKTSNQKPSNVDLEKQDFASNSNKQVDKPDITSTVNSNSEVEEQNNVDVTASNSTLLSPSRLDTVTHSQSTEIAAQTVNDSNDETVASQEKNNNQSHQITPPDSTIITAIASVNEFAKKLDSTLLAFSQNVVAAIDSVTTSKVDTNQSGKKSLLSNLFAKKDSTSENDIVADEIKESETTEKKKFKLFAKRYDSEEDTAFINRYAQATFITPLGSNGIDGSKYLHYVSFNILQGNSGALKGVEFGGLANIEKGYMHGAQFGGLFNLVGGSVHGVQFGGLGNTSRSLKGAQFGGVANVNMRDATGVQVGGVANVSAGSEMFNGWQIAGVANYVFGNIKGVQLSGAANVNVKRIDGGQISGAFNIANENNGFQIGVINVARKINGFQLGIINLADTMRGGSIGLINASRNGQFSVDVWSSDYLQFNGGLKIGNKSIYNVYAFGISPIGQNVPSSDSLNLVQSPLPFGFGLGIGGHIPIKKAFINIDGMCWTMHDRYLSFNGVNLLNQVRVLGGYNVHKYFGVYAGPVFNVSVQDVSYGAFRKNPLFEDGSANTRVRGWIGFAAGIQLF